MKLRNVLVFRSLAVAENLADEEETVVPTRSFLAVIPPADAARVAVLQKKSPSEFSVQLLSQVRAVMSFQGLCKR